MGVLVCKFCGRSFDTALGLEKCNFCGADLPWGDVPKDEEPRRPRWPSNKSYQAAHIPARSETDTEDRVTSQRMGHCPECGMELRMAEGCCHCVLCGFSMCG